MKSNKINILILAPYKFIKLNNILNKNKFNFFFKYKKEKNISKSFKKKIDGIIVNPGSNYKINQTFLENYINLKIIVTPSTGVNHIDNLECDKRKIKVISLLDNRRVLNSITASAEFTFSLILYGLRKMKRISEMSNIGDWRTNEDFYRGYELDKKKVGIVGLGRIGKKIERYCTAFGAICSFYDPYVKTHNKRIKKVATLNKIFSQNNIIVLCPYLNNNNYNMINKNLLNQMKKNSILINTSRGEIINEDDLLIFIKKRKDVLVNLDVIKNEQVKLKKNKILNYYKQKGTNLMITPHVAGLTYESQSKAGLFAINCIIKYFEKK